MLRCARDITYKHGRSTISANVTIFLKTQLCKQCDNLPLIFYFHVNIFTCTVQCQYYLRQRNKGQSLPSVRLVRTS